MIEGRLSFNKTLGIWHQNLERIEEAVNLHIMLATFSVEVSRLCRIESEEDQMSEKNDSF